MPNVSVKIEGLDAVINFTKMVTIRLPRESNKLNEKLAKNTESMAKTFLRNRRSTKRTVPPTGWLESTILAYQQRPTEWRVKMGTPYGIMQEYGKIFMDRKFIPMKGIQKAGGMKGFGFGNSQEGISRVSPGDMIVIPAKHFMRDAIKDTEQKADKFIDDTVKEILK